jgi:Ca2+-binding EF-hand superfamily protein
VRKIFVKLDENGNGMISKDEMRVGLDYLKKEVNLNLTEGDIDQIFFAMDFDSSGYIDYSEFIASFLDCSTYMNEAFLRKEFTKLDQDKDGMIEKSDIEQIIRLDTLSIGKVDVQEMINEADLNGDGKIDYNEFLVLLR